MKSIISEILLFIALYLLPAGIIFKYGNRMQSGMALIPIVNIVPAAYISGQNIWDIIHE